MSDPALHAAFAGPRLLALGPLAEVAAALHAALAREPGLATLVFDPQGRQIDLDLRGSEAEVRARHAAPGQGDAPRPRGRPKLGVVAREVTLLPRHWEWLRGRGGASAAIRRLVEAARRAEAPAEARDAAFRFISAAAGDRPGFEEAARALYAGDAEGFAARLAPWPADLAAHALRLAGPAFPAASRHLEISEPAVRRLLADPPPGAPLLLELIRLRDRADYAQAPEHAPEAPITGAEAFARHLREAGPLLRARGGEPLLLARAHPMLAGPEGERWDRATLVREASLEAHLAGLRDPRAASSLAHRAAAVADCRLIPLSEMPAP
ncbi:DUF2239 family protein [Albimonas pacifica]|uniref:DUF2239 domain-containing protein n=1 Tax=Albimonas pacifica TaxID=1114924 RepID=A0A1I3K6U6_9RHOB|nr:DUF2239 family protein [Albimonas pacifica]SFI68243.1 hypothetical protein SAMN05216258_108324 [Albimonas pacifica]